MHLLHVFLFQNDETEIDYFVLCGDQYTSIMESLNLSVVDGNDEAFKKAFQVCIYGIS